MEEVGRRQARRKLRQFSTSSEQALWFASCFGLELEYLQERKAKSGSPVKISFQESQVDSPVPHPCDDDRHKLLQVMYVLDTFAVSDEAYHELSSVAKDLPPLYKLKGERKTINESLDIRRLPGPCLGAYRPLEPMLAKELLKTVGKDMATGYQLMYALFILLHYFS